MYLVDEVVKTQHPADLFRSQRSRQVPVIVLLGKVVDPVERRSEMRRRRRHNHSTLRIFTYIIIPLLFFVVLDETFIYLFLPTANIVFNLKKDPFLLAFWAGGQPIPAPC